MNGCSEYPGNHSLSNENLKKLAILSPILISILSSIKVYWLFIQWILGPSGGKRYRILIDGFKAFFHQTSGFRTHYPKRCPRPIIIDSQNENDEQRNNQTLDIYIYVWMSRWCWSLDLKHHVYPRRVSTKFWVYVDRSSKTLPFLPALTRNRCDFQSEQQNSVLLDSHTLSIDDYFVHFYTFLSIRDAIFNQLWIDYYVSGNDVLLAQIVSRV